MDKYKKILNDLREQINNRVLGENDRIPTEAELCRKYKVSRITAMRAVKELQYAGFVKRVSGRGTFVNRQAQYDLRPFHLLIPHLKNRYYSLLSDAFGSFFRNKNIPFVLSCNEYDPDYTSSLIRSITEHGSSGLAIIPPHNRDKHHALQEQLNKISCPVVIGSRKLAGINAPQVIVNEEKAGYDATMYLLEHNHSHVLYIGSTESSTSASVSRYRGVLRAMQQYPGKKLQTLERIDSIMLPQIKNIFSSNDFPTAIIAADDIIAACIYDLLKTLDMEPGQKIAIIGLDGGLLGLAMETPLTTLEFPGRAIGQSLAANLYAIFNGEILRNDRRMVKLEAKLIVRASCGEEKKVYRHEYLRELINNYR